MWIQTLALELLPAIGKKKKKKKSSSREMGKAREGRVEDSGIWSEASGTRL